MKNLFASILLFVLLAQLTGCGSPALAPTSTPPPTATPTPAPTDTPVPTPTLEPAPVVPAEIVDEIDQKLVDMNTKGNLNGIVLVAKDGNVLLHKAYGMADHKLNIPLKENTLMPLLTFDLEAAAILLLDHQGKLFLEEPICKYLPDCPENWSEITINNLLYHSWEIPHDAIYANIQSQVDWWEFWLSPTRYEQIIEKTGGRPFIEITPPADAFWSWMNYVLQDKIIEQVSGESPGEFINKNILEPLGISHLGKSYTKDDVAIGYGMIPTLRTTEPYPDNALFPYFPVSTVEDLYRLSQEYLDPKVLPIEVVEGLRKEFTYSIGQGVEVEDLIGLRKRPSWKAYTRINGKGSVNWWSYNMGYSGAQFISFEDQVVIIIFTNVAGREYTDLLQSICEKLIAD